MDIRGKFPSEEDKKLIQTLLKICRYAVLQTTRNKSRGQADVKSIMGLSSHMEKLL